ncbi:MAG: hypothetical protein RL701_3575 [Pseudomonadota bacterium]
MSESDLIERTYRAYFTVFQMRDPRAITPYYHIPSLFVTSAGAVALTNVRDAELFFERLIYTLRERDYARSVLTRVEVKMLAAEIALLNASAERYTGDGQLAERVSSLHTFRKEEGTWRITMSMMYDYDPAYAFDLTSR